MFALKGFIDFLTVYLRKPRFLAMIGVLAVCVFVMEAVYGQRAVTDIPIYVVDMDNSTVSRTIRTFLEASPDLHVLGAVDTPEQAKQAFFDGDAAAVVFIPDGLSQRVKTQNGGHVYAYIDGTSIIMARNADKAIQTVVKTTSVGVSMVTLNKKGVPDFALMGALQPVNLDVDRPFNALTIYSDYLLPVLTFFCLNIFICIMTCATFQEALPKEIEPHKIRRRFYYLGRLLAVFALAFAAGFVIYQYGLPRVDIVLQSMPLMAGSALLLYIVITIAMFACINLILPTNLGMSISFLLCMLSVMFSGLTWPIEMMPWYLQEFVTWIPLTPFLQAVQVFLYHDANWGDLSSFGIMFLKQAVLWLCMAFIIMRLKDIRMFLSWSRHRLHPKAALASASGGEIDPADAETTHAHVAIVVPTAEQSPETSENPERDSAAGIKPEADAADNKKDESDAIDAGADEPTADIEKTGESNAIDGKKDEFDPADTTTTEPDADIEKTGESNAIDSKKDEFDPADGTTTEPDADIEKTGESNAIGDQTALPQDAASAEAIARNMPVDPAAAASREEHR